MSEEKLLTIRLALDDNFIKIQAQSTYPFGRSNISKIDLIGASSPVIFEYSHPECGFVLPPALFVSIALESEHAVNVRVSPHLRHLTLDESFHLLRRLGDTFSKAHWKQLSKEYSSWESLRKKYDDPATDSAHTTGIETWRFGDDEIYLTLERHWQRGELFPEMSDSNKDLFVATVNIEKREILSDRPDGEHEADGDVE